MKKINITSKDVAKLANVSQATVSYVLNNTHGKSISDKTRKQVLKAVEELNYTPNNAARVLKTNQANCVALRLATNISLPRYHAMLQGVRSYLEPKGYNIILCSNTAQTGRFPDYINACVSHQAIGVIYIASDNEDIPATDLDYIQANDIPLVAIDCMKENPYVSSVNYDYFASTYICADYLIQKGFQKIYYIRPDYDNAKEVLREKGVKAAVYSANGITMEIHTVLSKDINSSKLSHVPWYSDSYKKTRLDIQKIIYTAPNDVCFVCSLGEVDELLAHALCRKHYLKTDRFPWHTRAVNYHFAHYEAGLESARSLLNIVNGMLPVRKLTLEPILNIPNPDLFQI